jgi:hypothetical protein
MRILASHYALLPELRLVKYPKLYLQESNEIERIEFNEQEFIETPSTEFFGGLMIPGFIANLSDLEPVTSSSQLNLLLGRLYRDSIQYVILPSSLREVVDLKANAGLCFLFKETESRQQNNIDAVGNPWQMLCQEVKLDKNINVIDLLDRYLVRPWKEWLDSLPGGIIQQGSKPGIMLVNGIDWPTLTFTKSLTIQRLHGC